MVIPQSPYTTKPRSLAPPAALAIAAAVIILAALPAPAGETPAPTAGTSAVITQAKGSETADADATAELEEVVHETVEAAAPTEAETVAPPPAAPTAAEAEAARLEEEHRRKREEERKIQMAEAEEFVIVADQTLMEKLPYPLNLLLSVSLFGITLWRFLAAAAVVAAALLLNWVLARRFAKLQRALDDPDSFGRFQLAGAVTVTAMRYASRIIIFGLTLYGVSSFLVTSYHPDIVWLSNIVIYLGAATYFLDLASLIDAVYGPRASQIDNRLMETVRPLLVKGVQVVILIVAGMHIYQDLTGKTMFSVIAGLGIGGLALALASQETLRNLLGFASIAFDKAFLVGDAVSIAGFDGTIENVGLRSMRIRTYDGRSVVIPNNTAISSNIVNLNRRPFIRREMRIALSPKNCFTKLEQAMELIREALDTHEGKVAGLPPVVRFVDFEPGRFVIQAMFWYDAQKPFYQDECSRINLEVAKRLCEADIQYAEWPV